MPSLDEHGQPLATALNHSRNRRKALATLLGLCDGLVADRRFNDQELGYLDLWLRDQEALRNDADVIDILDLTGDILADGIVTADELEDLKGLLQTVVEGRLTEEEQEETQALNRLNGIVRGITADGVLHEREVHRLERWIANHRELARRWPADVIANRVESILADGVVTEEERKELLWVLTEWLGGAWQESGSAAGGASRLTLAEPAALEPAGRSFCFTGRFLYGSRTRCEQAVTACGGTVAKGVTKGLDYLVVGTLASRDWSSSSHGRKIEQAMALRAGGASIAVIAEQSWARLIAGV